jgi:starvation-inducible DNA-binding protein
MAPQIVYITGRANRELPLSNIVSEREHVDALSTALATFGTAAREAIDQAERFGDADTADVFTQISRETDKQLWLVEAHLYS